MASGLLLPADLLFPPTVIDCDDPIRDALYVLGADDSYTVPLMRYRDTPTPIVGLGNSVAQHPASGQLLNVRAMTVFEMAWFAGDMLVFGVTPPDELSDAPQWLIDAWQGVRQ